MECITGSASTYNKKVMIKFDEPDEYGAIAIGTCGSELSLPKGVFTAEDYTIFKMALDAAIAGHENLKFNMA